MNVFIDTNILLNFFHFTSDELDGLNNVFASHAKGAARVHLTEQVRNEFHRNREAKIKDALQKFNQLKPAQLPSFMRAYEEYGTIRELSAEIQKAKTTILNKATADIAAENLHADQLIGQIFQQSEVIETSKATYRKAKKRVDLGDPPGKDKSIGDAINWIILLDNVPDEEDLHIISEDGDYYSTLDEEGVRPFLRREWRDVKGSEVFVYRTLSAFMTRHFDGVALSFDLNKKALIDDLLVSPSFAHTHIIVDELSRYGYFSLDEARSILHAAATNSQVGMIITDNDVRKLIRTAALPHRGNLTSEIQKHIIERSE